MKNMSISRRSVLGGFIALPAAMAAGASSLPSGASAATVLDPADFALVPTADNATISALDAILPNATVDAVLNSANRTGSGAIVTSPFAARFLWQSDDGGTTEWYPQGITTSADYHDDGYYNGRKVVLVSWYDSSTHNRGVRVSFVDMTSPTAPVYRHVLLVEPYGGASAPNFRAVRVHAGGIFWYGDATNNYLYVVDTNNGLRVFDLNHLWKVTSTGDETPIGKQSDGTYQAYNYAYVLPQKFAYEPITYHTEPPVRFSFVSLDRTTAPDSIVIGEYDENGDGTRLFRWSIDYTTRRLVTSAGVASATWAEQVDIRAMQGATSIHGKFYISRSNGQSKGGDMLTWVPGSLATINSIMPIGNEDVSYDHNTNQLWSVAEYPDNRSVYALDVSQIPG